MGGGGGEDRCWPPVGRSWAAAEHFAVYECLSIRNYPVPKIKGTGNLEPCLGGWLLDEVTGLLNGVGLLFCIIN